MKIFGFLQRKLVSLNIARNAEVRRPAKVAERPMPARRVARRPIRFQYSSGDGVVLEHGEEICLRGGCM